MRSWAGSVNSPRFNYHSKKLRVISCSLVQPIQRLPVFIAKIPYQPDRRVSIMPGRVGQQFAKVVMIGSFQLVFDYHWTVAAQVMGKHVQRERTDCCFSRSQL